MKTKISLALGEISVAQARDIIKKSRENLVAISEENPREIPAGYDPLRRHRASDPDTGTSSRFFGEDVPALVANEQTFCEIVKGNEPGSFALCVIDRDDNVGTCYTPATPISGHVRVVEDEHGHGLQARPCDDLRLSIPEPRETARWTVALCPVADAAGETYFVLASAYPGAPDPAPDMTGLRTGDVIDAAEVRRRHLRVRTS